MSRLQQRNYVLIFYYNFSLGTSILPPSLNFFNVGNKKEKPDSESTRASTDKVASSSSSNENQKGDSSQKTITKMKPTVTDKKKVPNTLQRNINKFKTTSSTVQALKKKYQEQRLAKQRIKNKFKASCVMRTRSCTERTVLKPGNKLASRKFLPRMETKRLGLRSSVLATDKTKKASSKVKPPPPKPKKKVIVKQKSETSNSDSMSEEEEEGPSEKSVSQTKRAIQKNAQKNICTRSKSDLRRVTRSHSGTISPKNLSRRPTRKTKEAAAVYMEILGRKLVSPDLENEDNISMESFPELPNARKITQTESEIKAKVKLSTTKTITRNKDGKIVSIQSTSTKRLDKTKANKIAFKSKRLIRVQKYCEIDSDEESVSSNGTNNTRPVTRRSLGKLNKPANRFLRSSSKNVVTRMEIQTNIKSKSQIQNNLKFSKEKFVMKRKREQSSNKSLPEKDSDSKQKEVKNADENTDSDEETLGMLLNKLKRKKGVHEENEETATVVNSDNHSTADKIEQPADEHSTKMELPKVSDDEESFRGFTKKAISKVLNSCQTHVNVNLLVTEKTTDKLETTETENTKTLDPPTEQDNKDESLPAKISPSTTNAPNNECVQSEKVQNAKSELPDEVESQTTLITTIEKECHHKTEISSTNVMNIPLSTLHVRKEKVNMSTEQIEKWLNESSFAKEESKLEMETVSTFKYDVCEKKADVSHLSISTKIQHLVRPVNVTLSKLTEKVSAKDRLSIQNKYVPIAAADVQLVDMKQQNESVNKNSTDIKDIAKGRSVKSNKDSCVEENNDTVLKSDQNLVDGSAEKKLPAEKKSIFQPRKPFLPKVKERKTVTPNANAFSPENESSVYAFESDTEVPVNTPFRRKVRESNKSNTTITLSENDANKSTEKVTKDDCEMLEPKETLNNVLPKPENKLLELKAASNSMLNVNKFELPKNFATLANIQVLPLDKLTTTWSNVNCSASIAVQVNLDDNAQGQEQSSETNTNQQKSTEISTQTENNNDNDDENDGQLFYIPLQAVTRNGPNLVQGQQLIQGVAVKLGTEGPNGPNQKVLLRAKLVTKPPSSIARCPPVGTVQPTTRAPPNSALITTDNPVASTSATSVISASTSELPPPSPCKSENTIQAVSKQNIGTVGTEKLTKSPKASRERKTSIDSNKNGKRYAMLETLSRYMLRYSY